MKRQYRERPTDRGRTRNAIISRRSVLSSSTLAMLGLLTRSALGQTEREEGDIKKPASRPRAEIRWYVESLMGGDLAGEAEKQKLRDQWRALIDDSAAALATQFPFLDPNVVQTAKADYLKRCYRDIEAPLLPILRHSFSGEQIGQLKERWTKLRYARVDLWRQLGGGRKEPAVKGDASSGKTSTDYLLTQRSLGQLQGQLWAIVAPPPDYYRKASAQDMEARSQRLRLRAEAHRREERLGVAVLQTEYLSFLLGALSETSEIAENGAGGPGGGRRDGLQGERRESP